MQQSLFPDMNSEGDPGVLDTRKSDIVSRKALNEAQYQAVTSLDGPILVVAGAGSGKTRTLVYRVAHLIDQGIPPENILLLTFTRKASQEMLWRASLLLDDSCNQVTGGTFHAVANMLLRRYGGRIGYPPNFTIIDRADAEGIINILKSSLALGGSGKRFPTKRVIINIISKAVNKSMSIEDLLEEEYDHLAEFMGEIITLKEHYEVFKFDHGLMDYDDLLINFKKVLEDNDTREEISAGFSHIMVDEYQDTNHIQAEIVRLLAYGHDNVMVVGDDAQSIYSFRGADFKNIMVFPTLFPGTKIIKLEENYRSTQPILSLTNAIIDRAVEKYTKNLFTRIEGGDSPKLYSARDAGEEARIIIDRIISYQAEGLKLKDIAVLFRSGFHSFKLEMELAARNIPFEKRGGMKLTESAHIKDIVAYFRVLVNPQDNLSWNRILLHLDKVGPKTAQKILDQIKTTEDPVSALGNYKSSAKWMGGLRSLAKLLQSLSSKAMSPIAQFEILFQYYEPIFERIYYEDYPKRSRDLDQLGIIIEGYDSLQTFVEDTALDPPEIIEAADNGDRLILSTVHSAKGLEWEAVFVINLVDGKFPVSFNIPDEQIEEERRLLYVAATRAKKRLVLTYPREIMSPDRKFSRTILSPFLSELPAGLFKPIGGGRQSQVMVGSRSTGRVPSRKSGKISAVQLNKGTIVEHSFFGKGTVESIAGRSRVDVLFDRHGRKTLHLDYAKLKIIG